MRKDSDKTPQPLARSANPSALGAVLQAIPTETPLSEIELARVRTRLERQRQEAVASDERASEGRRGLGGFHTSLSVRLATGVLLLLLAASAGAAGTFVVMRLVVGEAHVLPRPLRGVVAPATKSRGQRPTPVTLHKPDEAPVVEMAINVPAPSPEPSRSIHSTRAKPVAQISKALPPPIALQTLPPPQEDATGQQARLVGEALAALARPQDQNAALSQLKSYVAHYPQGVFVQEAKVAIITTLTRSDRQNEALQALEDAPEITAANVDLSLLQAELLVSTDCGRARGIFARNKQLLLTPAQSERADFGYARALQACGRQTELANALKQYTARHPQGSRIATVVRWLQQQEASSLK